MFIILSRDQAGNTIASAASRTAVTPQQALGEFLTGSGISDPMWVVDLDPQTMTATKHQVRISVEWL